MCGLVGFYPKKNKQVDLTKLYPLWILNEERGTHSCGISFGPNRYVGVTTKSKARDFIIDVHEHISKTDLTNMPIICHTRHATNGAHTESNAHPFRWHRETEDNFFTFAHNGVIKDLYNLKKKLGMSKYKESLMSIDSQVLGLAMYDSYESILTEEKILTQYEGSAAFICYDKNNLFKVWKGANLEVEERPLYYIEAKEGWYFCSMSIGLAVNFLQEPILVPNNTLITFSNNKLVSSTVYKRNIEVEVEVYNNFRALTASNTNSIKTKNYEKTTDLTLLNNVIKLTLNSILNSKNIKKESKSEEPITNKIEVEFYGSSKAKYCLKHNISKIPVTGSKVLMIDDNSKLLPILSSSGRVVTFQNGVIVQPGKNYYNLESWFKTLYSGSLENSLESIFNVMYNELTKTIVDYIPFYDNNTKLIMITYLRNGKLDYITIKDKISQKIPSILGIDLVASVSNDYIFLNKE